MSRWKINALWIAATAIVVGYTIYTTGNVLPLLVIPAVLISILDWRIEKKDVGLTPILPASVAIVFMVMGIILGCIYIFIADGIAKPIVLLIVIAGVSQIVSNIKEGKKKTAKKDAKKASTT